MKNDPIAERFARETAEHAMTVLHDDGLYRHLRFQREWWQPPLLNKQRTGMYWFEIITAPGTLIFRGDGESFVFARVEDMFEFFRSPVGRINPSYWAEKLTSGRGDRESVRRYDREVFERVVKQAFVDAVREREAPAGLGRAVRSDLLEADDAYTEESAHRLLHEFSYYRNEKDRWRTSEVQRNPETGEYEVVQPPGPDFEFSDTWEWDLREYDWWFLWALHGIVWGIAQYDAARQASDVVAVAS